MAAALFEQLYIPSQHDSLLFTSDKFFRMPDR
jgi:hypothetical protein